MRKNIVAGNWKMNLKREDALALVSEVLSQLPKDKDTEVVFAPCFYRFLLMLHYSQDIYVVQHQ